MNDSPKRDDTGLIGFVILLAVCTFIWSCFNSISEKDTYIKQLEAQVNQLQGELKGYSQGRR